MKQQGIQQHSKKSDAAKKRRDDDAASDEQDFDRFLARSATPRRPSSLRVPLVWKYLCQSPPLEEERIDQIQKLLAELDLKIEDFTGSGLGETDLERLLYPSRAGIVVR